MLVYGIPEFRLPKAIVRREVELAAKTAASRSVQRHRRPHAGPSTTLMQEDGYHAVFIANGAGLPFFLGIDGENLKGVYSANDF